MPYENRQFELMIVRHCACVLKKKKVANMFHIRKDMFTNIHALVEQYNQKLNHYDLFVHIFQEDLDRITIYLYEKESLKQLLEEPSIKQFLSYYGYPTDDMIQILHYLDQRLHTTSEYPHEIGIFLGYPLDDVLGFIKHLPCLYCGYWKVYQNKNITCQLFKEYDLCIQSARDDYDRGVNLEQLIPFLA